MQPLKSANLKKTSALFLGVATLVYLSGCTWTGLASVNSAEEQADLWSLQSSVSADGRFVAFQSRANNLVPNDTNANINDIFVRDLLDGNTERVNVSGSSTTIPGTPASANSSTPAISGDGRYVAFTSDADNLVANDTNGQADIFLHDRSTGDTTRVSTGIAGAQGNARSTLPAISGDGRYIAFNSRASNLIAGDNNNADDIFVHDQITGLTSRVNVSSSGAEANNTSYTLDISSSGRYVAFSSRASNFFLNDTGIIDIFVHDRNTGSTTLASLSSGGTPANSTNASPSISQNGRYVAFRSNATNLVPNDTNFASDVFVRDRSAGTTTRASLTSTGAQGNSFATSDFPSISDDGRFVAFYSEASTLVPNDTNGAADLFLRDRTEGITTRISVDAGGAQADSFIEEEAPSMAANGKYVAYATYATNMAADDTNGYSDIIVRAIPGVNVTSVIPSQLPIGATTSVTISGSYFLPGTALNLPGAQFSNIVIVNETTVTADITVGAAEASGSKNLSAFILGTGAGSFTGTAASCISCVTFF